MSPAISYEQITVSPIAGALGAEISGVDLGQDLGNQLFQEIHDALMEHQVIFFRDQDISPSEHVAFARHFGSLQVHPFTPNLEDHPEVLILESKKDARSAANQWHSDVPFAEEPPLGSVLLSRICPEHGGDTMWANMYDAYDALSPSMKRYLDGMIAVHSADGAKFETLHQDDGAKQDSIQDARQVMQPVEHPVVRTHPVTGRKALFVNAIFTQRLRGVPRKESKMVLDHLYEHIKTPELSCRFRWQKNSIAFWDNRCTQHYAIADYGDVHRLMHRVTVNGDRPV